MNATVANSTPELPLYVDSTMLVCARSCLQKFYLEFVLGCRPPGLSADLHAGACFATALEIVGKKVWGEGLPLQEALVVAHAAFAQAWGDFTPPPWKTNKTYDRIWAGVEEYFNVWSPLTDHIRPYMDSNGKPTYEYTFAIPLEPLSTTEETGGFPPHPSGQPFVYSGRFDLLGQYQGRPIPRDEKSASGIGDKWAEQWQLRNQFMGYVWALQQCGFDCQEAAVRGIAFLVNSIKTAEHIQPYSKALIAKWHEQLRRDIWRIRRAWDNNYWDYNFGESCTAYGNCQFLTPCASSDPTPWLNAFEVRRWNPLLKNPVGA